MHADIPEAGESKVLSSDQSKLLSLTPIYGGRKQNAYFLFKMMCMDCSYYAKVNSLEVKIKNSDSRVIYNLLTVARLCSKRKLF